MWAGVDGRLISMSINEILRQGAPPVIAILRGLTPDAASAVGRALVDAGIRLIEVPLNSPDPLSSIARLSSELDGQALVGAGTVLSVSEVEAVHKVGGKLVVSPNTDERVIRRTVALGMDAVPGFLSPTEAFLALAAGARRLKLFPAASLPRSHIKALREVLPRDVEIWAVGGIEVRDIADWLRMGAGGFGVGGSLYKAGDAAAVVGARARELVNAWRAARG